MGLTIRDIKIVKGQNPLGMISLHSSLLSLPKVITYLDDPRFA